MNIFYLASVLPECYLHELKKRKMNYVVAPQKFHSILLAGFVKNGHIVKVITHAPDGIPYELSISENGIDYYFCNRGDNKIMKPFSIAMEAKRIANRLIKEGFKAESVICDSLNVSLCLGGFLIRKSKKLDITAIVTDIMGISAHESHSLVNRMASRISNAYIARFDKYVFLTEQMNAFINKHKRPYIVMEGVCTPQDGDASVSTNNDNLKRVFYAGGRPSKDGVDMLIAAFKQISGDYTLDIYGPLPGKSVGADSEDSRIYYHGIVGNEEIVREEHQSILLVNPRPTDEEYTKYSFPSKLMEYMNTGTAVVTTRLPGVPTEYFDYVYTFDEVSIECYKETLERLLVMDKYVLNAKGKAAQEFVRNNKNNVVQTQRIVELIEQ